MIHFSRGALSLATGNTPLRRGNGVAFGGLTQQKTQTEIVPRRCIHLSNEASARTIVVRSVDDSLEKKIWG